MSEILKAEGWEPLTIAYRLPEEEEEFARAKHQLSNPRKGKGVPFRVVMLDDDMAEIWTKPTHR